MLPVPKLCIKYNLVFWNEPKTKSINIQKFFVSLHSLCFLWCSKVRTILHGSLCWHAFIIFVVLYKCIPADDIIMMILCISPLSSQYCPSLTSQCIGYHISTRLNFAEFCKNFASPTGHGLQRWVATVANTNQSAAPLPPHTDQSANIYKLPR